MQITRFISCVMVNYSCIIGSRRQSVQNAAARLVTSLGRREHIGCFSQNSKFQLSIVFVPLCGATSWFLEHELDYLDLEVFMFTAPHSGTRYQITSGATQCQVISLRRNWNRFYSFITYNLNIVRLYSSYHFTFVVVGAFSRPHSQ